MLDSKSKPLPLTCGRDIEILHQRNLILKFVCKRTCKEHPLQCSIWWQKRCWSKAKSSCFGRSIIECDLTLIVEHFLQRYFSDAFTYSLPLTNKRYLIDLFWSADKVTKQTFCASITIVLSNDTVYKQRRNKTRKMAFPFI